MDKHAEAKFPWSHVIGYILSLVLTIIALVAGLNHMASLVALMTIILVLAAIQILVQLFFFMHITEKHGPRYNVITLIVAFTFTFAIIGGSIWIMAFSQVSS